MKNRPFKLSVENPCSEDWTAMTSNEQGRFCDHCSKSVTDFTKLSDREISKLISSNSDSVCGRLKSQQLNRIIEPDRKQIFSSPHKFLTGLFIIGAAKNAFGSNVPQQKQQMVQSLIKEGVDLKLETPDTLVNIIEGIVIDEGLEPVPGVIVEIQNTELKAISDIDGKFKFILPDSFDSLVIILCSKYPGGTIEDVVFDRSKKKSTIEMMLIITATDLDMIGLLKISKPKKWWQFRKRQ